jgi:GMP synthase (glutamine-hydrolysing)
MAAMPDRCLVLQHAMSEGPERLRALLEDAGLALEVRALYLGEPVPRALAAGVPLVVMGGSMGVADAGDPAYPFLDDELALLRDALAEQAPVLGICLGAQLLAHAGGARVYPLPGSSPAGGPAPVREVGWAPVDFRALDGEPALAGLPARATMLHWHGDTFDLPPGAVHLASTPACAQQAFRLGRRAFGLQFHPEVEPATLEHWLRADADYVAAACGPDGADRIRADTARHYAPYREAGDRLLRNIIGCLLGR